MRFLYHTAVGRMLLKLLMRRWFSKLCGGFLQSPLSKPLVRGFVKKNGIDLSQFEGAPYKNFNACFSRKIKAGLRPVAAEGLISPCDGLVSAYRLQEDTVLPVKQSAYTLSALLQNEELAAKYRDGLCVVFRLCVEHYHRYCYCASGMKGENTFIQGKLHTIRPIALRERAVFAENCREYTVLQTEEFGDVLQMEVGALLVGKILNYEGSAAVTRGAEKGTFLFGGSSILLLLEKDRCKIAPRFFEAAARGEETPIRMGESLME